MPRGNLTPKLAITVDPDVHAEVVEAAAAEGVSVSAWMTAAARRALRVRSGSLPSPMGSRQRPPDRRGNRRRATPRRAWLHSAGPHDPGRDDAGILAAADPNSRAVWADHRVRLEAGIIPVFPAPVIRSAAPPTRSSSAACCADATSSP